MTTGPATVTTAPASDTAAPVPLPVRSWRLLLLLPAGLCLLAGLAAGLAPLGLSLPRLPDRLLNVHGMLLVVGVLGTGIAFTRAVALGHRLGYLAPGLLGVGGLALVSPAPLRVGQLLLLAGALALLLLYRPLWRRQRDPAVLPQAWGAVLATGAALLWLAGVALPALLPWLAGFAVLTGAGERVARIRPHLGSTVDQGVLFAAGAVTAAAPLTLLFPGPGLPLYGLALLGLTGWLLRHEPARHHLRTPGAPRLRAAALLAGYGWLVVAGATWLFAGAVVDGLGYEATVHAVVLGFAISLAVAHTPVRPPVVRGRPLAYHPALWLPLGLWHGALVGWLGGDALGSSLAAQVGGVLSLGVLLFGLVAGGAATWAGRRREVP